MLKNILYCLVSTLSLNVLFSIDVTPYVKYHYSSDTELYAIEKQNLSYLNIGSGISYSNQAIKFDSNFSYHIFHGINQLPNSFNPMNGFPNIENSPGLSSKSFNYFFSSVRVTYDIKDFQFYAALDNPIWGLGVNKIILSDKVPPFFNIGYKWDLTDKISYEHLYGNLNSLIKADSTYLDMYSADTSRYPQVPRSINAHKIDYELSDFINLGLFEVIVYGGYNRDIEPYYLLPFIPFFPIQTYLGDLDNDILGGYFNFNLNNKTNFYSTLVIDEWTPPYTFNKKHKNWFIYQIGINTKDIIVNSSKLVVEYIWSDNRVYNHKFSINNFYSYNYPLGFWGGPHAEQIYIEYTLPINNFNFLLSSSNSKRGEHIYGYGNNFVERYSGIVEKKGVYRFIIEYIYKENLSLYLGYSYINWKNSGFNPSCEEYDSDHSTCIELDLGNLNDIIKNDFSFRLSYFFKSIKL